jgi:hypothetical protein
MKDQYFADERDLLKYDLWMELADHLIEQSRLTFVPMLTGPDGTKQGGRTNYFVGKRRKCLYDFLQVCLCHNRRAITELRLFFSSDAGRAYRYHPYRDGERKHLDHFEDEKRKEYFASIPSEWLSDSVVLIDPDTGLETKGRYWKKGPERYAQYADIMMVAKRTKGNSALVVVQFPQRDADRAASDLDYRAGRLRQELRCSGICDWSVHWIAQKKAKSAKVGDLAFFVLGPRSGSAEKVENLLQNYAERHDMALDSPK